MPTIITTKHAGIYARVSTFGQHTDLQLRDLREYCERRGWKVVEYVDTGVSGAQESREQLDRLMRDARQRKLDMVVCWRFDRFARSTKHLLDALEEFKSLGVAFVSEQEAIDTTTPMGKMVFTVISALAEFERAVLIERVRAGIGTAKSKGKTLGRPKRVFRRDVAIQMRAAGTSWRTISKALDVPVSTIRQACAEKVMQIAGNRECKADHQSPAA
jgi:DNA invertase Pin-like site-specific DNA recombinase